MGKDNDSQHLIKYTLKCDDDDHDGDDDDNDDNNNDDDDDVILLLKITIGIDDITNK